MYCKKCEENIQDENLLKHLRDYHQGEKDLEINCPACNAFYSNGGSFQKHWYSQHHTSKRKLSSQNDTNSSKKFVSDETGKQEPIASPSSVVESPEVTDAVDLNVSKQFVSDKVFEQETVASPSHFLMEIPEATDVVVESSVSQEIKVTDALDISSDNFSVIASSSSAQSAPVCDSQQDMQSSDDSASDDEKSESDAESEVGLEVHEAVKSAPFQSGSLSVNKEAASYLLNLNASCHIPSNKINLVIGETEKLIKNAVLNFASKVNEKLKDSNLSVDQLLDVNAASESVSKVFENIRTVKRQKKNFKEMLGVIEPKAIPLGSVLIKVQRKGRTKTVLKQENIMIIPLGETLDKLIHHPDYESLLDSKRISEYLNTYMKGSKCKSNPVLLKHPHALRFILYYDDLEACSPLKSKAGKHKLGAFYLLLDNIGLEHRSNLSMIFLVALVNANYVKDKKYGMDAALEVVVAELRKFEKGVVLPSGKKVYGTLIASIGDNLGSHTIGGFKEGFTAHCCCRYCMATYEQCQKMFRENPKLLRTVESHTKQCAEIQTVRGKNEILSTKYGVNRDSGLNALDSYHVVGGLPPDILHDILEGVLPLAIKNLLNHFLEEEEPKFELPWLNSAINDFDYGYAESSDKPSPIKKDHLKADGSLHQSGCQTWLLAIMLPLLIGPLLSKNDKHFDNYLELLDICRIVFSTDVSDWMIPYLGDLIESYLSNFYQLYGNLIPKQHYLCHYPTFLAWFGSLLNYMCMRCEAKHKFFKDLVHVLGNYKNLPLSLSYKHQLDMAANWAKSLKKATSCGPCHSVNLNDCCYLRLFPGYGGQIIETNWLKHGGYTFKPDNCFLCIGFEETLPVFVKLFKVLIHPIVQLVCENVKTVRRRIYLAAYEIQVVQNDMRIVKIESLALRGILHAHRVEDAYFIMMRHTGGGLVL